MRPKEGDQTENRRARAITKLQNEKERNVQGTGKIPKREDHGIDMSAFDMFSDPPPPPPPPVEKVIVEPKLPSKVTTVKPSTKNLPIFAKSFTIASLQQYTNSFSEENRIGSGRLGTVYRAQLPDGKVPFSTIN